MKTYTVVSTENLGIDPTQTEVKVFSNKNAAIRYSKNKIALIRKTSFNGVSDEDMAFIRNKDGYKIKARYYDHVAEVVLYENTIAGVTVNDLHKMMLNSELELYFTLCDDEAIVTYDFSEDSKYHNSGGELHMKYMAESLTVILEMIAARL